jgi:hypothetical protein
MHGPRRNDSDPNASGHSRPVSRRNQRFTSSGFSFFVRFMAAIVYITYYAHIQLLVKNFLQFRPEDNTICHRSPPPEAIPCGFQPGFLHRELARSLIKALREAEGTEVKTFVR